MEKIPHKIIKNIESKWCSSNKHWKPTTEFGSNRSTYDHLDNYCKECKRKYNRQEYKKQGKENINVEYRRQKSLRHYWKTKRDFLKMYGEKCNCCGESNEKFLTIEHRNGQVGIENKERGSSAYRNALKNYRPDLYETLCYNCNFAKSHYGVCPHQNH